MISNDTCNIRQEKWENGEEYNQYIQEELMSFRIISGNPRQFNYRACK